MNKHLPLLIFLLVCFGFLQGQIVNQFSIADNVTVCDREGTEMVISITNDTTQRSQVDIAVALGVGIEVIPDSISVPTGQVAVLVSTNNNQPTYRISSVEPGETIELRIRLRGTCDARAHKINGGIFDADLSMSSLGTPLTLVGRTNLIYDAIYATLSVTQITNTPPGVPIGQTTRREVTITNGAFGAIDSFTFAEVFTPGDLAFTNFVLDPGGSNISLGNGTLVPSGDSVILVFDRSLVAQLPNTESDPTLFEEDEQFVLAYDVQVIGCGLDIGVPSRPTVFYGCDGVLCQADDNLSVIPLPPSEPSLAVTYDERFSSCYGSGNPIDTILITLENRGFGAAANPILEVNYLWQYYMGLSRYATYQLENGPVTNFRFGRAIIPMNNSFGCLDDYPGTDTLYTRMSDTLPIVIQPGEKMQVKVLMFKCCPTCLEDAIGNVYRPGYRLTGGVRYTNQCGGNETRTLTPAFARQLQTKPTYNIPTTFNVDDTLQARVEFPALRVLRIPMDQNAMYFELAVKLPGCIGIGGADSTIRWYLADSTLLEPYYVSRVNDSLVARWRWAGNSAGTDFRAYGSWIEFPLTLLCANRPCPGRQLVVNFDMIADPGCSRSCPLRLACFDRNTVINCPGPCTGFALRSYIFERENVGPADMDNNGCPDNDNNCDGTNVQAGIPEDPSLILRRRALSGDTIFQEVVGQVVAGNGPPTTWTYMYSEDIFDATVLSLYEMEVTLIDGNTGSAYTCNQVPFVRLPDRYTFDLSIAAIAQCAGWPKTHYGVGDSVIVTTRYVVSSGIPLKYTLYDFDNNTFLSDVVNPTSSANRFACGGVNALLGATRATPVQSGRSLLQFDGCESQNDFRNTFLYVAGAGSGNNFFPYEYRQIAKPIRAEYTLPPGWNLDSARFSIQRTAGQNVRLNQAFERIVPTTTLVRNDGAVTLIFDLEDPANNGIFVENGGSIYLSDDGFRPYVQMYISPGCNAQVEWDSRVPGNVLSPRFFYRLLDGDEVTAYNYSRLYFQKPFIQATSANVIKAGKGNDLSTDFSISNFSELAKADNTWAYLVSPSGNVGQNTLTLADDKGNILTPNAGGIYPLGDLDLREAKDFTLTADYNGCTPDSMYVLYGWNCRSYPADAASIICKDTIVIYFEPPATSLSATISPLALTPSDPSNAKSPIWGKDSVVMCEGFPIEISLVASQEGNVFDVKTNLNNPDGGGTYGLEYMPGSAYVEYPEGTTPRPFSAIAEAALIAANNTAFYPMDLAVVDPLNFGNNEPLTGVSDLTQNKAIIRLQMKPTCDITGGESFEAESFGKSSCGQPAIGDGETVQGFAVAIEGAPRPYFATVDLKGELVACSNALSTFNVRVDKLGLTPTAATDLIEMVIPANVVPVIDPLNPVKCSGTFCPTYSTTNTLPSGEKALIFTFPAGMGNQDSLVFSFKGRISDPSSCSTNSLQIRARTLSPSIIACKGVPCPNFFNLTGSSSELIQVNQSDLYFANTQATSVCGSRGRQFSFSATIANRAGDISAEIPIEVDLWKDINGNGMVDQADSLITVLQTISAAQASPFEILSFTQLINGLSEVSPMIAVLNGCVCDTILLNLGNLTEQCAKVGNFVWNDVNANGVQETGETGVPGVRVTLNTCTGVPVVQLLTDALGGYEFTNVAPGSYYVSFDQLPAGFTYSLNDQGTDDELDSDPVRINNTLLANTPCFTLASGECNLSFDAGIFNPDSIPANQLACIGDRVWEDLFPDGRQNFGERGLGGVEVNLLDELGLKIRSVLTDSMGLYRFDSLIPAKYYIEISTFPVSYRLANLNVGRDPNRDSDIDPATGRTKLIELKGGSCDLSWDAGFFRTCEESCAATDYGAQDGVSVFLFNSSLLPEYKMVPGTGNFEIDSRGDAILTGTVQNEFFPNQRFRMEVYLENRRNWVQWSALGRSYKPTTTAPANAYLGWDFFELDSTRSRFVGEGVYTGDTLFISHMPSTYNFGFQYGKGANGLSSNVGLGGWLYYTSASGNFRGVGDIFIDLDCQQDCSNSPFFILPMANLQGAYDPATGTMRTALQQSQLVPSQQPYGTSPWNYQGTESLSIQDSSIVDWMLLEIRDGQQANVILSKEAVLVHADGAITRPDGSAIEVNLPAGVDSFYVALQHRNHLGVMTSRTFRTVTGAQLIDLTDIQEVYTDPANTNTPAATIANGQAALLQGDQSSDNQINSLDLGGVMNQYFTGGIKTSDVNLDGVTNSIDVVRTMQNYFRRSHTPR
ncbi:MAG: SdrD B-like domain-containing protein [Bacteroidia bacterium]